MATFYADSHGRLFRKHLTISCVGTGPRPHPPAPTLRFATSEVPDPAY